MTSDPTLSEIRALIAPHLAGHAVFDGWTPATLRAAALDAGVDRALATLAFPGGGPQMIEAYIAEADQRMVAAMLAADAGAMKVRERITFALRTRLEQAEPHREAIRRALALLALPGNLRLSARTLWRTADTIWRAAGDTATDYNHYTKRLILGGVYSATLLHWLDDDSDGRAATWAFLDRRIAGIMSFEKAKSRLTGLAAIAPRPARFLGRLRYPAV